VVKASVLSLSELLLVLLPCLESSEAFDVDVGRDADEDEDEVSPDTTRLTKGLLLSPPLASAMSKLREP
jgi:hypothetical protein